MSRLQMIFRLALPLFAVLAPGAAAQMGDIDESITASFSRSFGGWTAGGSVGASASTSATATSYDEFGMERHSYEVEGLAEVSGSVRIMGRWRSAFRVEASANMQDDTGSTGGSNGSIDAFYRLGPWTLGTYNASYDLTRSNSYGPYNILGSGFSATWWLGPVPVLTRARASVGGSLDLALHLSPFEHDAQLTPSARGYVRGSAFAGVGIWMFSAGVSSTLNLGDTRLGYTLIADLEDGLSGHFTYAITPIRIWVRLYAEVNLWWWSQRWYRTVYNWSAGTYGGTKTLH